MSGVANFKPKAVGTFTIDGGELLDFDAWLVQRGLDRATVDALFADHVKNETEEAPEVAHQRKLLELYREHVAQLREAAAKAQADLDSALDGERNMEAQLTMAKLDHLQQLVRQAQGIVDGDDPGGKPNGKRKSRRS